MNPIQRTWGLLREFFTTSAETISTQVRTFTRRWRSSFRNPVNNWGRADYDYFRRLYYGHVQGLELSGLLVKPIVSKLAAWTLGRAPRWKLDSKPSQDALTGWWADHHSEMLRAWRGALTEADAFAVVNSDLSVTLLPPDCVDPIVADDDYGNVIGWRVTQVLTHPETTQRMTMVDEYYADRRVHSIEVNGRITDSTTYPNLLGRLTITHIPNAPQVGEVFGHAEVESLLGLLHKYGEVLEAAIEGNVLQGRPTPVLTFETPADLEKFDEENATYENQTLPDGTTQRVKTYAVDLSQLLIASGAKFEYKSPGSFTGDTAQLLEIMFYLALEHSELPEFVFGNAVSSSHASVATQMPVFVEFIKARRGDMVGWLTDIAEIALGYLALTTPGVNVETPTLQWEALDQGNGQLTLDTIEWAKMAGLMDELTALQLLPIEVEDAEAVLDKAHEERDALAAEQVAADNQNAAVVQSVLDRVRGGNNPVVAANGNGNGARVNGAAERTLV